MTKEITNLLSLRTESLRQFRIAFRTGGPAETFRAEIHELNRRILAAERKPTDDRI